MPAADVLALLRGQTVERAVVGVTWLPVGALDALFRGRIHEPAQALGAFVAQAGLDAAFVPADETWAAEAVDAVTATGGMALWALAGPMGRVEDSLGWLQALKSTVTAPAELAFLLDEALHEALEAVREGVRAGAGAIVIADDLAGASGPLLSPDYALEALLPLYRRLAAAAGEAGLPAVFHSDGDIRVLLPALSRAGFAAVHPGGLVDDALAALATSARSSGLAVMGGIAGSRLLAGAKASALASLAFAADGGVIITDDGGIASPEELAAFVTAVRAIRSSTSEEHA